MEEALVALLLAAPGVAALAGTRLYWSRAPQDVAKPYVVLTLVSGNRDYEMLGPSGLAESRVQVDAYGITFAAAKGLARAIEAVLSGYRGTSGGIAFGGAFLDAERDLTEDNATPDKLFRTSTDYIIWHQ